MSGKTQTKNKSNKNSESTKSESVVAPVAVVVAPVAAPVVAVAAPVDVVAPTQSGGSKSKKSNKNKVHEATLPAVVAPVEVVVPPAVVATQVAEPVLVPSELSGGGKKTKKPKSAKVENPEAKSAKSAKSAKVKSESAKSTKVKSESTKSAKSTKTSKSKSDKPKSPKSHKALTETEGEVVLNADGKHVRSFKVQLPGNEVYEGRFTGLTPYQAANKALSKYYRETEKPEKQIMFSIRESTRGSKRSTYTYNGRREKLQVPVEYAIKDGRTIVKNFKNRLTKIKKNTDTLTTEV